jgi:superfamily II DNA or RNA helicase
VIIGPVTGFVPRPYQEHCINGGDPRRGIGIMPAFARYKRVLAVMATGCHERGQLIMLADGSTRRVEDIEVGDLLMGPDLTPRTVLSLARGRQQMARIVPHSPLGPVTAWKPWRVNLDHILTLTTSDPGGQPQMSENWIDISVRDYLAAPARPWPLHLIRIHAHGDTFDPLTGTFTPRRHEGCRLHPRLSTCAFTIEHCSVDDYFGFTLDGDHRYLLADGTVTHNCGKTETYLAVIRRYLESARTPPEKRAMLIAHRDELVSQPIERAPRFGLRFAREQGPDTAIGKPERAIASTIQSLTANRVRSAATALGYRFEKKRKKDPTQVALGVDPPAKEKGDRFTVWSPAGAELGRFDIKEFTKLFKETHPGVPTCRMEEYDPNEIGLIVLDECHHSASDEHMKVLEYFIHAFVLGVTATPERLDGIGMEEVFEAVAYCYPIEEARPDGWLVDAYVSEHPIDGLDLSQLRKRAGDLPPEALGELMAEYSMPVAANIVRLAGDRPTIVFCATVAHAHSQAAALRRYTDERVEVADGGTDKDIRRDVVADFRAGAVRYLVNAMLWTEGFDAPNASCIALVRPTCSRSLLLQCIGRGTRPEPGVVDRPELRHDIPGRLAAIANSNKPNLLVLDFTSQVKVVGLASPADVLAGRLTPEERLALAGIKLCGDRTIDELTREAIRLAAAAAAEAAALSDAVAEDAEVLDPWDPSIVMSMKLPRDDPQEARCSPAQAAYLTRCGIESAEKLSASRAKTLSGALAVRQKRNLCTYKQQLALQKVGVPPSTTTRMYIETAAKLIDQLVSNRWRRPKAWDDQPKLGGRAPTEARA